MLNESSVASPCTNLCILDSQKKLCLGCYRTIEEILHWITFSDEEKKHVMEKVEERRRLREPKNFT